MSKAHEVINHHGTTYRRFKCDRCKWWHLDVISAEGVGLQCYINEEDHTLNMAVGDASNDEVEQMGTASIMGEGPVKPVNFLIAAYHGMLRAFYAAKTGCIEPDMDVEAIPAEHAATILGRKAPTKH